MDARRLASFLAGCALVWSACAPTLSEPGSATRTPPAVQVDLDWYSVGSAVATIVNLPARGALCGIAIAGLPFLWGWFALVPDSGYDGGASALVGDTCDGPWTITPEMVKEWHEGQQSKPPAQ